jgi:hypothetical protein
MLRAVEKELGPAREFKFPRVRMHASDIPVSSLF